jgi:hypothetical protein
MAIIAETFFSFLTPIPFPGTVKENRDARYFSQGLVYPGNYRGGYRFGENFPAAKAARQE